MKPGSNQNSSNLGFEGGAMKLNYSFFFPLGGGERGREEGRRDGGRERMLMIWQKSLALKAVIYIGLLKKQGE